MAGNHFKLFKRHTHAVRTSLADIFMRCAVEAVTANSVFFKILIRQSIHIGHRRHGAVESSVKHGNLRNLWTEQFKASFIALKVSRIVKRSKRNHFFNIRNNLLCKLHTFCIFFTALNNTVTNRINLIKRIKHFKLTLSHELHNSIKCINVRRNFLIINKAFTVCLIDDILFAAFNR